MSAGSISPAKRQGLESWCALKVRTSSIRFHVTPPEAERPASTPTLDLKDFLPASLVVSLQRLSSVCGNSASVQGRHTHIRWCRQQSHVQQRQHVRPTSIQHLPQSPTTYDRIHSHKKIRTLYPTQISGKKIYHTPQAQRFINLAGSERSFRSPFFALSVLQYPTGILHLRKHMKLARPTGPASQKSTLNGLVLATMSYRRRRRWRSSLAQWVRVSSPKYGYV